jgi:hypothetical protein
MPVTGNGGPYVFPVRYEHNLHIKKHSHLLKRLWKPIGVFPVRYEHHIHIKIIAISVTGHGGPYVFSVKYEHHVHIKKQCHSCNRLWEPIGVSCEVQTYLHIKSKAIAVTDRGRLQGYGMLRIPHYLDNQLTDGGDVVRLLHRSRPIPQNIMFLSLAFIHVRG